MAPSESVRVEDLPAEIRSGEPARAIPETEPTPRNSGESAPGPGTLREFKDAAERAYLVQKLRENSWNISRTAELIDTPRSNLYKKLEQYRDQAGSGRIEHNPSPVSSPPSPVLLRGFRLRACKAVLPGMGRADAAVESREAVAAGGSGDCVEVPRWIDSRRHAAGQLSRSTCAGSIRDAR